MEKPNPPEDGDGKPEITDARINFPTGGNNGGKPRGVTQIQLI